MLVNGGTSRFIVTVSTWLIGSEWKTLQLGLVRYCGAVADGGSSF